MTAIENERGERLVSIQEIDETAAAAWPVIISLVIGRCAEGFLLVHNIRRKVWELPDGFIDVGESARQCALRELQEESGQTAQRLRWRAVLELRVPQGDEFGSRYGALYCADIAVPRAFVRNEEVDAIGFWPVAALPADVSAIDRALIDCWE